MLYDWQNIYVFGTFMYLVRELESLSNLGLLCLLEHYYNLEKLLGWCYIDLHIGLIQTSLSIDSMLELL